MSAFVAASAPRCSRAETGCVKTKISCSGHCCASNWSCSARLFKRNTFTEPNFHSCVSGSVVVAQDFGMVLGIGMLTGHGLIGHVCNGTDDDSAFTVGSHNHLTFPTNAGRLTVITYLSAEMEQAFDFMNSHACGVANDALSPPYWMRVCPVALS